MICRIVLSIFIVFTLSSSSLALEVTFQPHAKVSDLAITLGDIVRFDESSDLSLALGSQIISNSPQVGDSITLSSIEVKKNLSRKTTLPDSIHWSGSPTVNIVREGQEISPNTILQEISKYLKDNSKNLPKAEIRFIAKSIPLPFLIPTGNISWEIIPSSPSIIDSSSIAILIRVDDRVRKNFSIQGKFQAIAPVAVANTSLRRGEILTPKNTSLVNKDITEYRAPCLSLRNILGKRLKRSIKAGHVIDVSNVETPPLVRKGQLVKIIVNKGAIFLSATGIARMNGTLNQIIRVRNANSNKIIHCRITAPGIVEVII